MNVVLKYSIVSILVLYCSLSNVVAVFTEMSEKTEKKRLAKWYFGGLGSAGAACVTHPLDLLKVHLQTQQDGNIGIVKQTGMIVRNQGVLALYNGISASLLRQLTYSTTRFAIYEMSKQSVAPNGEKIGFAQSLMMAAVAGGCGGKCPKYFQQEYLPN